MQIKQVTVYDSRYNCVKLADMINKRGSAVGLEHFGSVYVFGGLNYSKKVLSQCEKFSNSEWTAIADMKECRKNASAVALNSDSIYVFGGSSNKAPALDSIEQYSVGANRWNLLKVKMPQALCYLSCSRQDDHTFLILGGCTKDRVAMKSFKTNKVWSFSILTGKFTRQRNLSECHMSVHPVFNIQGRLILLNEDGMEVTNHPSVIEYTA